MYKAELDPTPFSADASPCRMNTKVNSLKQTTLQHKVIIQVWLLQSIIATIHAIPLKKQSRPSKFCLYQNSTTLDRVFE